MIKPPGVYGPQRDTRLLAEALRRETLPPNARVLDVGTGPGTLALLAARHGAARVTAVDISHRAVLAARMNVLVAGLPVRVLRGDLLAPVGDATFDLVLSNPPYVPCDGARTPRHSARWDGGEDGRRVVDRLCAAVPDRLAPGGVLLMVHSAMSGLAPTLDRLAAAGLAAEVVDRQREPFGPVLRSRVGWLTEQGLVEPGQRDEELVVIRAQRPRPAEAGMPARRPGTPSTEHTRRYVMTTPQQQPPIPAAVPLGRLVDDGDDEEERRETDDDGTPVGREDAKEDARRTGGDPDAV
jgi:release factor glutamine methyltransferase